MKNSKMLSAFNAFEVKNKVEVKGGGKITWAYGGLCDIDYGKKEVCNVPDGNVKVGSQY